VFFLQGVNKADPENGGYEYLQWSDYQRGYHEGIDLNAGAGAWGDEGLPLLATTSQVLEWSGSGATGFGNHQWWRLISGPYEGSYVHYAHAQGFEFDDVGHECRRGDVIGRCGHTGTTLPHLHCVVTRAKPSGWSWYGAPGVPREAIAAVTWDPVEVCDAYTRWADGGSPAIVKGDETVTPELQAISDALASSNYPAGEVPALIASCAVWQANSASLASWIEEIGALKARVTELEAAARTLADAPAEATPAVAPEAAPEASGGN